MDVTANRQPKGVPVGGQYAPQEHAEVDIVLDDGPTVRDRWSRIFTPQQRAVLTRNGVTADRWVEAAEALEQDGYTSDHFLAEAHYCNLEPEEAKVLFEVCGTRGAVTAHNVAGVDFDRLAAVPEVMRPINKGLARELSEMDPAKLEQVAEAWPHTLPGVEDDTMRFRAAVLEVDLGIDQRYADSVGTPTDWHRARLVKETGMNPAIAASWAPCYPTTIESLEAGGWNPDDLPGLTESQPYDNPLPAGARQVIAWANGGATKAEAAAWTASGFGHYHDAAPYLKAGVDPAEAREWEQAVHRSPSSSPISHDVAALRRTGVTPAQAKAADEAGLTVSYDAAELIPTITADEIRGWSKTLAGGSKVSARTITQWRDDVGVTDPARAKAWVDSAISPEDRRMLHRPVLRFVNSKMDPSEVEAGTNPIVTATARELGLTVDEVKEKTAKAKDPVEGCRTMFRRRKLDVPF